MFNFLFDKVCDDYNIKIKVESESQEQKIENLVQEAKKSGNVAARNTLISGIKE